MSIERQTSASESIWSIVQGETWDRCFVRQGEVRLVWQKYVPDQQEPQIDFDSIPVAEFLAGRGHAEITQIFGRSVLVEVIQEATRRNPTATPLPYPKRPHKRSKRTVANRSTFEVGTLLSLALLFVLAGWLIFWPARRIVNRLENSHQQVICEVPATITRLGVNEYQTLVRNSMVRGCKGYIHVNYTWNQQTYDAPIEIENYVSLIRSEAEDRLKKTYQMGTTINVCFVTTKPEQPSLSKSDFGSTWLS